MPDPTDNAKLAERLRETTSQMARRASVDMDLWNEHSNAVLEAATALASSAALNERLVTSLCWAMCNLRSGLDPYCGNHRYHEARALLADIKGSQKK